MAEDTSNWSKLKKKLKKKTYTKSKQKFTCKMNKHLTLLEIPRKPNVKARIFFLFFGLNPG